jgi:hypothetical protein
VDHPSSPVAHVSGKTIASFTNHFWCAAGVEREQCGRKSHAELWPEVVPEARRLRKAKGKAGRLSYREISARLKEAGYSNERGQPFNPQSVRAMLEGPQRRQRRAERSD